MMHMHVKSHDRKILEPLHKVKLSGRVCLATLDFAKYFLITLALCTYL